MEYRTQAILGSLQGITVLAGVLIVLTAVKMADGVIEPSAFYGDPLAMPRRVGNLGILLLILPPLWVFLSIRHERSDSGSKATTLVTGIALLTGLVALFGWAAVTAMTIWN